MSGAPWLRRAWPWLAVCIMALIGGWLVVERPAGRFSVARIAPRWVAGLSQAAASVPGAGPAPAQAVTAAAGAALPPGAVAVCGGGWLQPQPDGTVDVADLEARGALDGPRDRLLQQLAESPDAYARGVAAWLRTAEGDPAALARIAYVSADPRVYSLAFQACGRAPDDGDCGLLSAEQWARLDPGNAAPWFYRLADAARAADRPLLEESLHRLATADRNQVRFNASAAPLIEAMSGSDGPSYAGWQLVLRAVLLQGAVGIPAFQALLGACRGDAVQRDANRQQTCRAAAEVLATGSDTVIAQLIGARLAAELGGPADRAAGLRASLEAYAQARTAAGEMDAEALSCSGLRRALAPIAASALRGEAGALRDWTAEAARKAAAVPHQGQ